MRAVVFSPDGTQVAYVARRALMVARSDSSAPRERSGDAPDSGAWSPNGERFAITVAAQGDRWPPNQLQIVDVAAGLSTVLFEGGEGTIPGISAEDTNLLRVIGFSPAGDRILFSSSTISEYGDDMVEDSIWSIGSTVPTPA